MCYPCEADHLCCDDCILNDEEDDKYFIVCKDCISHDIEYNFIHKYNKHAKELMEVMAGLLLGKYQDDFEKQIMARKS